MTKQEFLSALSEKLREGMTSSQIVSQVRYYEGYIDGEIARGKTEEEAVGDLGDPILIARNILESPREEEDTIFGTFPQDQEDAYEEGSYQGENQHSEDEVRQAAREEVPLGETKPESSNRQSGEEKSPEEQKASENTHDGNIPIYDDFAEQEDTKQDTDSEDAGQAFAGAGFFHDSQGHFRWDLLGVILAFALGITAVIWLITKIVSAMSPVVIIILLVLIIVFLLIRFRS